MDFGDGLKYVDTHCHLDLVMQKAGYARPFDWLKFKDDHEAQFGYAYYASIANFSHPSSWIDSQRIF